MSQKQKQTLCKKFVSDPGDELYGIVQKLVPMRTQICQCVYPSSKPCPRMCEGTSPFGFCAMHLNTTKGMELATLWNQTLEELDISESSDIEEEVSNETDNEATDNSQDDPVESEEAAADEESEEPDDEEEEPEPTPPVRNSRTAPAKKPAPTKTVASPSKKIATAPLKKSKTPEPNIKIIKAPRKSKAPVSEESSAAEGSAKTKYVTPHDEEEESPAPLPALTFQMGKHGNYVNPDYGFVLRLRDQVVLGTENKNGGIIKLTPKQIQICKERNVNYLE